MIRPNWPHITALILCVVSFACWVAAVYAAAAPAWAALLFLSAVCYTSAGLLIRVGERS